MFRLGTYLTAEAMLDVMTFYVQTKSQKIEQILRHLFAVHTSGLANMSRTVKAMYVSYIRTAE